MSNKIDFYAKIRWIITYISEEIEKIPASQKTKEQILSICGAISSEILRKIGEVDDEKLMDLLDQQLLKFHRLIKELENNKKEEMAYMLLITHVADILFLVKNEKQK
jgi:hypothetical protein